MTQENYYFEDLAEGMEAHFAKTITDTEIVLFTGITGDFNPLHIDDEAAQQSQFHRRIVPGMLTSGLISATLGRYLPGPGCIYLSQTLHFMHPIFPGETAHAYVKIRELQQQKARVILDTRVEVKSQIVAIGESIMKAPRRPQTAHAIRR